MKRFVNQYSDGSYQECWGSGQELQHARVFHGSGAAKNSANANPRFAGYGEGGRIIKYDHPKQVEVIISIVEKNDE